MWRNYTSGVCHTHSYVGQGCSKALLATARLGLVGTVDSGFNYLPCPSEEGLFTVLRGEYKRRELSKQCTFSENSLLIGTLPYYQNGKTSGNILLHRNPSWFLNCVLEGYGT
jgi:hypothetical protein